MKVLILRFSSIGDIVLTSPVIRCLKKQIEGAEVHYFTKAKFSATLSDNPYIDKLWLLDNNENEIIAQLKHEKFDIVLDLHNNIRTLKIKSALGNVKKYTVNKNNIKKWLMVNLKLKLKCDHIVDRYLATCQKTGVKNDFAGLDFFIKPGTTLDADIASFIDSNKTVGFAIGGTYATKRLPVEKIEQLIQNSPDPIILLGDHNDSERVKELENKFGNKLLNACGRLSLQQSAFVLEHCKTVISHDSGLMHIAAALKKPVISIWGNTVPEFGMGPYFPVNQTNLHLEAKQVNLNCRPCSKLGYHKCPKGHFNCMMQQEV